MHGLTHAKHHIELTGLQKNRQLLIDANPGWIGDVNEGRRGYATLDRLVRVAESCPENGQRRTKTGPSHQESVVDMGKAVHRIDIGWAPMYCGVTPT